MPGVLSDSIINVHSGVVRGFKVGTEKKTEQSSCVGRRSGSPEEGRNNDGETSLLRLERIMTVQV